MKIKRTYIAVAGALVFALAAITFVYTNQTPTPQTPVQQVTQSSTVTLNIQSLYTNKAIEVASNETVLEVLQGLNSQDPELALTTKEYSGMGALVTGMHGLVNGKDKKYWQYKVNDVMPQIGAGDYKLKNGDSVEWFFGASQE
jgi:hypothetical protein